MPYVIGTKSELEALSAQIDRDEDLPRPPDAWPPGFNPQLGWVAGGLIPGTGEGPIIPPQYYPTDPPVGWTAHYYGEPKLLTSGEYALQVEDRHSSNTGTLTTADTVVFAEPVNPMEHF